MPIRAVRWFCGIVGTIRRACSGVYNWVNSSWENITFSWSYQYFLWLDRIRVEKYHDLHLRIPWTIFDPENYPPAHFRDPFQLFLSQKLSALKTYVRGLWKSWAPWRRCKRRSHSDGTDAYMGENCQLLRSLSFTKPSIHSGLTIGCDGIIPIRSMSTYGPQCQLLVNDIKRVFH